ncbi:unnamed protein product [Caenorhabditis angaria]|uniref:Uncharacterized protein n=1 Tax=Caenorhabditis angaria TaxID=860376 RepID=A0A9P1MZU9_9PELO|nr:unnamed protein product [Caenorhabditis angaria]
MSATSSSPMLFSSTSTSIISSPVVSRLSAREQLFATPTSTSSSTQTSRIINVPISAPWYNKTIQSQPSNNERNNNANTNGYQEIPYRISYEDFNPSQMRDHIRFNIDLSHDLPLSISRR